MKLVFHGSSDVMWISLTPNIALPFSFLKQLSFSFSLCSSLHPTTPPLLPSPSSRQRADAGKHFLSPRSYFLALGIHFLFADTTTAPRAFLRNLCHTHTHTHAHAHTHTHTHTHTRSLTNKSKSWCLLAPWCWDLYSGRVMPSAAGSVLLVVHGWCCGCCHAWTWDRSDAWWHCMMDKNLNIWNVLTSLHRLVRTVLLTGVHDLFFFDSGSSVCVGWGSACQHSSPTSQVFVYEPSRSNEIFSTAVCSLQFVLKKQVTEKKKTLKRGQTSISFYRMQVHQRDVPPYIIFGLKRHRKTKIFE